MRKRKYYLILVCVVIALGLLSRKLPGVPKECGDVLWALMFFCLAGLAFSRRSTATSAAVAAALTLIIEAAKLYHMPGLDHFRTTTLGGLLLGHVFSWENILCYLVGIALGVISERLWLKRTGLMENGGSS